MRRITTGNELAELLGYDDINQLNAKIENEGFDYWLNDYENFDKLKGTNLQELFDKYFDVRANVIDALEALNIGSDNYSDEEE